MSLTCRTCRRMNPPDAQFCYYDGVALDGAGRRGPIAAGGQPFPTPFTFPSGKTCRTFDELALACDADWDGAKSVLQQGFLESFLGAMGRIDLAMVARQASRSPDVDRALDELLAKLPSTVREPAKLKVVQSDIDLGEMPSGSDLRLKLSLKNVGMGLLHGTVSCPDTPWLAVGDAPPGPQKMFHCRNELELPVHIVGKSLRAGAKPLRGKLLVESNGGTREVLVTVQVPIRRFPSGALAGAMTPRQVAEKAKAAPKEAAVLFANGAVANWYSSNGWTYPVQGPSATGLGAVQQFFEALGLVAAPKVAISTEKVQFWGAPGVRLEQTIQVHTVEKRPVYAYAVSKAAWLQVGNAVLKGQTAQIPLHVPSVPSMPGEELQGQVIVSANGNQRFTVNVALHIAEGAGRSAPVFAPVGTTVPLSAAGQGPMLQVMPPTMPAATSPFADLRGVDVTPVSPGYSALPTGIPAYPTIAAPSSRRGDSGAGGGWKHLVLLLLLVLGVAAMPIHDYFLKPRESTSDEQVELPVDPVPYLALQFHDELDPDPRHRLPQNLKDHLHNPTMRFGLVMKRESGKKLTFSEYGVSNNTCLRIDGKELLFGEEKNVSAHWVKDKMSIPLGKDIDGRQSVWEADAQSGEPIVVTQTAEIVPGEPAEGAALRPLNTCLISYEIKNEGKKSHTVGLRFLLDTYIGENDGVPFTIPGRSTLCNTMEEFPSPDKVPDFIQVVENDKEDSLTNPGTVARLQFRLGSRFESPSRVSLGGWPNYDWTREGKKFSAANGPMTRWQVPQVTMRGNSRWKIDPDSAVVLYWDEKPLKPGETRKVGFAYGLGTLASEESKGQLSLSVGGRMAIGGEFSLTAVVKNPTAGETLSLAIKPAAGLKLVDGSTEKQTVAVAGGNPGLSERTVTWKIVAKEMGDYKLEVQSSRGYKQTIPVHIRQRGSFD